MKTQVLADDRGTPVVCGDQAFDLSGTTVTVHPGYLGECHHFRTQAEAWKACWSSDQWAWIVVVPVDA